MTNATDLTQSLGGRWYGRYGAAPCPVCQPERQQFQNALTISGGSSGHLLLHCKKTDCSFCDIMSAAGLRSSKYMRPDATSLAQREHEAKAQTKKRAAQAKRVWLETQPIAGTLAETYLRGRGITCKFPKTLRFHSNCWHGPTSRCYPAMVAEVQGARFPAVHRTYLRSDGSGKADIAPAKAMLGATSGGAVRLTDEPGPLVVAEGIETALSLASGLLDGPATIWATLSTSGLRGLRLLQPPDRLTIATDGDPAGAEAGRILADRAHAVGWAVSMLPAPKGSDWNDILAGKGGEL